MSIKGNGVPQRTGSPTPPRCVVDTDVVDTTLVPRMYELGQSYVRDKDGSTKCVLTLLNVDSL